MAEEKMEVRVFCRTEKTTVVVLSDAQVDEILIAWYRTQATLPQPKYVGLELSERDGARFTITESTQEEWRQ